MEKKRINPIADFLVRDGQAMPSDEAWPDLYVENGYRWLHLDLNDEANEPWLHENLPDTAARAICQMETRPRCQRLGDGLILNLRGVNLNPESDPEDMVSLRLWITETSIVSGRMRKIFAVDTMRQTAEEGTAPPTVGRFLAELTYGLVSRIETVSLDLEEETDALEEAESEKRRLKSGQLAGLRRAVIKMRRFVNPQREAIATLASIEDWVLSKDELVLLRETSNRMRRIVEELDATRDRLSALQDHIEAERGHALSQNSYVLSVVAAIFLPLGFLTGLFGVNVAGMPGVETPNAFWILTGASATSGLVLFLVFKFSKWL